MSYSIATSKERLQTLSNAARTDLNRLPPSFEDNPVEKLVAFNNQFLIDLRTFLRTFKNNNQYKDILRRFKRDIENACRRFDPYTPRGAAGDEPEIVRENDGRAQKITADDVRANYTGQHSAQDY